MILPHTRRQFLRNSAIAIAAIAISPPSRASYNLPISDNFPLGVSSGDVTPDKAMVWTQYDGMFPLKLALWKGNNTSSQPFFTTDVKRGDGGFVQVDITLLSPAQIYQYAFIEVDYAYKPIRKSPTGKFKTAFAADSQESLTFGGTCCTFNMFQPIVLNHAAERNDLDFFMLLGDTSYNDGCHTLTDFRKRWAGNLAKESYVKLRQSTSLIATLDDHEIANDFNPETTNNTVLQAGMRSFFEHIPVRRNPVNHHQVWRQLSWGKTADIFVLDCRTERLPSRKQYISRTQINWLKAGLSDSKAAFKLIMNSVPISEFPLFSEADRWEGYPDQRLEILNHIDHEHISGILWISGDFHFASIGRVSKSGPGSTQHEILVGPGAQLANFACLSLSHHSQFIWASAKNNYMTFHLDPKTMQVEIVVNAALSDPFSAQLKNVHEACKVKLNLGR